MTGDARPTATEAICVLCGLRAPDGAPLTWTAQVTDRGTEHLCARCSREHLRGIEGRLDPEWW